MGMKEELTAELRWVPAACLARAPRPQPVSQRSGCMYHGCVCSLRVGVGETAAASLDGLLTESTWTWTCCTEIDGDDHTRHVTRPQRNL